MVVRSGSRFVLIALLIASVFSPARLQASGMVSVFITNGVALAINQGGVVVGNNYSHDPNGNLLVQAFAWAPNFPNGKTGVLTNLGALPGGTFSDAFGINNVGEVVGDSVDNITFNITAVYWTPSGASWVIHQLPLANGMVSSQAFGVNDNGDIVGVQLDSAQRPRATLWHNGIPTYVGALPGDTDSFANAINNNGTIVGASWVGPSQVHLRGFIVRHGSMELLKPPAGGKVTNLTPSKMNATDMVVGSCIQSNNSGNADAGSWTKGVPYDLVGRLNIFDSHATGINASGIIVGNWLDTLGNTLNYHCGYLSDGHLFPLESFIGGFAPAIFGINDAGQLCGSTTLGPLPSAFLLSQ